MIRIAEKLNIWIHFTSFGSRALCRDGLLSIFIDKRQPSYKQWEDFGHELCHVLYHEGNQLHIFEMFRRYQEAKADNFMFNFCIPTFMLRKLDFPETQKERIYFIMQTFHVSFEFAKQRLLNYENQLLCSWSQDNFHIHI